MKLPVRSFLSIHFYCLFDESRFSDICTIMELKELNWLCKHMKNVKSSQPCTSMNFCTEFIKVQVLPCEYRWWKISFFCAVIGRRNMKFLLQICLFFQFLKYLFLGNNFAKVDRETLGFIPCIYGCNQIHVWQRYLAVPQISSRTCQTLVRPN